jgi:hypothetical protein
MWAVNYGNRFHIATNYTIDNNKIRPRSEIIIYHLFALTGYEF